MQMQNNKTIKDPSMYFNSDRKRFLQKYLERNNTLKPLFYYMRQIPQNHKPQMYVYQERK